MRFDLLRRLVPAPVLARLRSARDAFRRRARRKGLQRREAVTRATLATDLRGMGLAPGDLVMVHSSLSGLGWVEGGAEAVLGALDDVLGPEGTLLMPVFPLDRPASDWLDLDPVYDPRTTRSALGGVSEAFRCRGDVVVGDHPTHPVAGRGPLATVILAGHGTSPSPYGRDGAFAELARRAGRILALGSPFTQVSAFHRVEDEHPRFPEPVHLPGTHSARVRLEDGSIEERQVVVPDPVVARRRFDVRPAWAARIEEECLRRGAVVERPAGHGRAWVFDAAGLERALMTMADEGITIYEPCRSSAMIMDHGDLMHAVRRGRRGS